MAKLLRASAIPYLFVSTKAAVPLILNSTNKATSLDHVGSAAECYTMY